MTCSDWLHFCYLFLNSNKLDQADLYNFIIYITARTIVQTMQLMEIQIRELHCGRTYEIMAPTFYVVDYLFK